LGGLGLALMVPMARIPRKHIIFETALFHVTWQCHNKDFLLQPRWVKDLLYDLLLKFKDQFEMTFFSYIIMDNHFHVSGQAPNLKKFSRFFQRVHSILAREVNKRRKRCGQVIRDRFKSPLIQDEDVLCRQMIYHDLNEVRCGKTNDPENNELSSYAHYAYGKKDPLITDPPFYLTLGKTAKQRQEAYRALVLEILVAAPRKKNGQYTQSLFIGDPNWVEEKYKELKEIRRRIRLGEIEAGQDPP
jgi:putative transposase